MSTRVRQDVYWFLMMPYDAQVEIVAKAGLLKRGDEELSSPGLVNAALLRAKEANRMEDLLGTIEHVYETRQQEARRRRSSMILVDKATGPDTTVLTLVRERGGVMLVDDVQEEPNIADHLNMMAPPFTCYCGNYHCAGDCGPEDE